MAPRIRQIWRELARAGRAVAVSAHGGWLEASDLTATLVQAIANGRPSLAFAESPPLVDAEANQGTV